LEDEFIGITMR